MELITIASLAVSASIVARLSAKLGKNVLELPEVSDDERPEEKKELKGDQ